MSGSENCLKLSPQWNSSGELSDTERKGNYVLKKLTVEAGVPLPSHLSTQYTATHRRREKKPSLLSELCP